jgi:hypothetical protein
MLDLWSRKQSYFQKIASLPYQDLRQIGKWNLLQLGKIRPILPREAIPMTKQNWQTNFCKSR